MGVTIRFELPSGPLRPLCAFLYVIRAPAGRHVAPIGCLLAQAHWVLRGTVMFSDGSGTIRAVPEAALLGMTTRCPTMIVDGPFVLAGIGLLPAGWSRLVRAGADALTDRIVDATALWGRDGRQPLDCDPDDDAALLAAIDRLLRSRLAAAPDPPRAIAAIDGWLCAGARDIGALVDRSGLSQRQLNRLSSAAHGASPQLLSLKFRTLRTAAGIANGATTCWTAAMRDDFYDQSHLIRNFRRFVGVTPRQFEGERADFVRHLLQARARARPDSPLSVWG